MDSANSKQPARRARRADRTHYIYMLVVNGQRYVGITAKTESTANKSVLSRMNKHWYRAQTESKDWALCRALRQCSDRSEIQVHVLAVVRGKAEGHRREVELRRQLRPELNTDLRGD